MAKKWYEAESQKDFGVMLPDLSPKALEKTHKEWRERVGHAVDGMMGQRVVKIEPSMIGNSITCMVYFENGTSLLVGVINTGDRVNV